MRLGDNDAGTHAHRLETSEKIAEHGANSFAAITRQF
jgi:hypothetical protein